MKGSENLLNLLKKMPKFNKADVLQLGASLGFDASTTSTYISRFLKRKNLLKLKNGLYVTTEFYDAHRGDISYRFYLANALLAPSYVSSWAALQYYDLTTEAVYPVTSVTSKVTRSYQTKTGSFAYQSIKPELFTGYDLVKGSFDFFIARPSKALFDLLYFRTHRFSGIKLETIEGLVSELRIDIDEMSPSEHDNFYTLIKNIL